MREERSASTLGGAGLLDAAVRRTRRVQWVYKTGRQLDRKRGVWEWADAFVVLEAALQLRMCARG